MIIVFDWWLETWTMMTKVLGKIADDMITIVLYKICVNMLLGLYAPVVP
jgi:hypothetical protein